MVLARAGTGRRRPVAAGRRRHVPRPALPDLDQHCQQDHPDISITYDAVGSGEGISRFITGSVDFGGSDAPPTAEQISQVERGMQLIPATAGMIVLAYNLNGLNGRLKLKRDVYVDIFLGKITNWNDPKIQESNPDLALPNQTIAIVGRLDGSGTTFALTNHFSAISDAWRNGPGTGTLIDWPGGAMLVKGNEGVAARIKISDGSIGYLQYGFAERIGLPMVWLENQAGAFVEPDAASGRQALAGAAERASDDLLTFAVDPPGEGSYPIVTHSWLMLYQEYPEAAKSATLRDFVSWGLTTGQDYAADLGYIPLSANLSGQALQALKAIK